MEGCGKEENIETKKLRLLCLHSEAQEVQANDRRYQETPPRERNHTSRDQFNSPKLIDKALIQAEPTERRGNQAKKEAQPCSVVKIFMHRRYFS